MRAAPLLLVSLAAFVALARADLSVPRYRLAGAAANNLFVFAGGMCVSL